MAPANEYRGAFWDVAGSRWRDSWAPTLKDGREGRLVSPRKHRGLSLALLASFAVFVLLGLSFGVLHADASVMAIDYGAQWFKVSLVKPGVPLEIVLNRESKRKTRSIVALRDNKRSFDTEAVNLAGRFPKVAYDGLKNLLGKLYEDPECEAYRSTFDNNMVKDPVRGTVDFEQPDGTLLSVEELVAMQFKHAKELAETMAGDVVRDCVITVPRFYNQFERQALLDAAELAGLRILALLHDDFAVALNFAMTRNFNETAPEYHIFYDMGAGSTAASLVSFQNVPADPRLPKKTIPQLEVKSVGFDRTLGGHEFDLRLQKLLATTFDKDKSQSSGKVFKNQRAMVKLLNQATKVKEILSANTEIGVSIESLMDDIDFRTKVTRQEFEEMCQDLIDRVVGPVRTVIDKAGLTLDKISSVILVGGSTRIPAVQAALRDYIGEDKIAKNVNSDEAAVLGAGFRGAGISRQFKVREIRVKDINVFPVEVSYQAEPKEEKEARTIRTLLFNEGAVLPSRKLMTFRRATDFSFELGYRIEDGKEAQGPTKFIGVEVPGLADAIATFKANESIVVVGDPKVKATIALSESGLVNVVDLAVYFDTEVPKEQKSLKDRVMSFFGGKGDNATAANATEGEPAPDGTGPGPLTEEKGESANETAPEPASKKAEIKTEKVELNMSVAAIGVKPMDQVTKTKALARLLAMDAEDRARFALAEARNQLEAFVYAAREFLTHSETEEVSTEEEREKLSAKLSEASEWLYGDGEHAELAAVKGQLRGLEDLKGPIELRRKERKSRPEAAKALRTVLDAAKLWVDKTKEAMLEAEEKAKKAEAEAATAAAASEASEPAATPPAADEAAPDANATVAANATDAKPSPKPYLPLHTQEELSSLLELAGKHLAWLNSKETEQEKAGDKVAPVLLTRDIEERTEAVQCELTKLIRRKKPPKPVTAKAATPTASAKASASSSAETVSPAAEAEPSATPAAEQKDEADKPKDEL
ncbi:Hsp70 protein-domain-containing protein [Hyaloraphidium curvatum]|nr:Hsp70 protein-domain-containing protein [Hyaloraphidium curvatum]